MKLAEALIRRADCQKRFEQVKSRLVNNAKVQEGDVPAESPAELLTELGRVANELFELIKRINKTNSATVFNDRDTLSEVKYVATINVAEIQKSADGLAKNYRELDARIQELNWQTELLE